MGSKPDGSLLRLLVAKRFIPNQRLAIEAPRIPKLMEDELLNK
ncbi:MAG: hypothetical protein ABSE46_14190 [Terracidiphilus sp.]|jgi:hypothetical protein